MHKRSPFRGMTAFVLGGLLMSTSARAQYPGPNAFGQRGVSRPTTSPYLNLLQGGNRDIALDYYRLVRPEQEWRSYTTGLNQRLQTVERTVGSPLLPDGSVAQVRATGHPTSFLNTGSYFPQARR